jgi:hypothetical protein
MPVVHPTESAGWDEKPEDGPQTLRSTIARAASSLTGLSVRNGVEHRGIVIPSIRVANTYGDFMYVSSGPSTTRRISAP